MPESVKGAIISKLFDSLPVLLILSGVLLFGLGIAGGVTYHDWFPIRELPARVAAIVAGVIVFSSGAFAGRKAGLAAPKAQQFGIEILYPKDGDHVDTVDVQGTIKKALPEGYSLRIFRLYPRSNSYIPIGEARVTIERETWVAEGCNIGGKTGDRRYIGAYLVGPSGAVLIEYYTAAARLHKAVMKRLKELTGEESEYLPLIGDRTQDMIECHRVPVWRK